MASKTQGTRFQMETVQGVNKTITAISAANPPVVTSAAHGFTAGTIVKLANVVGMVQVNNRAFVVANPVTNSFELKGVDGSLYDAYTSGGIANSITLTDVAEVTNISGFDGQADEVDVTHLRSAAKEFLLGLEDFGNLSLDISLNNTDTGQLALKAAKANGTAKVFVVRLTDATVGAFVAFVKSFTFNSQGNDAYRAAVTLRITGKPSDFT